MGIDRPSYPEYRRRLIQAFALLLVLLLLGLTWKLRSSYVDDRRTAQVQTKNFVQAMDAHVTSAIQIVDLALLGSAAALKSLDAEALRSPDSIRELLAGSGRMPDANFWLIFIDADGHGVVASNGLPIAGVSYADRPYFTAHVRGEAAGLFVGAPEVGKISRRRLFFLSRAVRSPTGRFLGVVAAPVDASVFAGVFQNALFQPGLSVTLVHADGKIIARAPRFEESFATEVLDSPLYAQMKKAPSGSYEATSVVDNEVRVFAYRTLDRLPLIISVGLARQSWIDGLVDDLMVAGAGLATILAVLMLSARFALRSYRRLEHSEAEHRRVNADLQAARERLADSEKRMRMVTDHLQALVAYVDADERYVFRNAAYAQVDGIDADAMIGRTMREVHGEAAYDLVKDEVAHALAGQRMVFERSLDVHGMRRDWKFEFTPNIDDAGRVVGFYALASDITDAKRIENRLRSQARIDALTGLPNRHHLYERLDEVIARCRRTSARLACLYLDIDDFKQVNDSLGHACGDDLLRQFGARLQACVRQTDLVARIAGDEFVIVIEGVDVFDARIVATKIVDAMQIPFLIDGVERLVTTSIGVVVATGRDEDPDSLLKKADARLYLAKRMGKNLFQIHDACGPG